MGTLQTSGNIRLSGDVAPHFGAGSAVLGQFKRAGSYVPNTTYNSHIPKTGSLALTQLYGGDNRTYSLSASTHSVNETTSRVVTITCSTTNESGSIHYQITGISSADVHESLTGTFSPNGSKTFNIVVDRTTESTTPERAIMVLYTDSGYGTAIGMDHSSPVDPSGDYGTTYFDISDTSKTWYTSTVSPSNNPLLVSMSETEGEAMYTPFTIETAWTPKFEVSCANNKPDSEAGEGSTWSVSAELDSSYGRVTSSATGSTQLQSDNSTLYQGGTYQYQGYADMSTGWPNGTAQPWFRLARAATFSSSLSSGMHNITIKEKGRIKFTEIGAPSGFSNRELYSPWCIFETVHQGVVA